MTRRTGLSTADLATFFLRAWQLRSAMVLLAVATLSVAAAGSIADSLQLSPVQRANAALGTADARLQLPGSAPIGSDGRELDARLLAAVKAAGGAAPSVDYVASALRPDDGGEMSFIMEEIQAPESVSPRLHLRSGTWPGKVGEALASEAVESEWPIGSTIRFFNGALKLEVVGTFRNAFETGSRSFVVPSGTWSSLRSIDDETGERLSESAGRAIRWSGEGNHKAIAAAVREVVAQDPVANRAQAASGDLLETRGAIEARAPGVNVSLMVATIAGPLVSGLLAGLLAGTFTTRTREIMWTVGVPYPQTRGAATLSILGGSALGALIGTGLGVGLGYSLRPLLADIATQELGPISSTPTAWAAIPLGVLGSLFGMTLVSRRRQSRSHDPGNSRERSWDRVLFRVVGAILLASFGVFVGTGTSDLAKMSLAAFAISLALIIVFAPLTVGVLGRISPSSFAGRLALRKLVAERGIASLTLIAIAGLQVLGFTLAILLTSTIAQVNDSTESSVPMGQIVFEPLLETEDEAQAIRAEFEELLGAEEPVLVLTVGAGSERADGPTKAVTSAHDLERVITKALTAEQVNLLNNGGSLLTKPLAGDTVSFPPSDDFPGATFPADSIEGLDPSFRNTSGFLLDTTAREAGLPLLLPAYVYTDVTSEQLASAKSAATDLNLNPDWVKVYRAPDVLTAPLRVSAITVLVSLVAGLVLLLSSISEARSMRPALAGLRAIGVSGRFVAHTTSVRIGLTFVLATVFAVAASAAGVSAAFALARLSIPITIPAIPIVMMIGSLALFAGVAAFVATRRLQNSEWLA